MSHTNDTKKRLAVYSAVAGALVAGSAHAAVVQNNNFPVSFTDDTDNNGGVSGYIDVDGDGYDDFSFYLDYNTTCTQSTHGRSYLNRSGLAGGSVYNSDGYYAGMVSAGTSIPGTMSFNSYSHITGCSYGGPGNFPPNSRGFVAVNFLRSGQVHYGYLDVETRGTDSSFSVIFHAARWEDVPTAALVAGGRANPIPVGGAIPLTLGVLGLGAAALRRRRH